MNDFSGVKIALIHGGDILVILRDNIPTIHYPNMWDVPGGKREDDETPFECMVREVEEELGIILAEDSVVWEAVHPAMADPTRTAYFMVAKISDDDVSRIVFGDEGQEWKMMPIDDFMKDDKVIEPLKGRLKGYLSAVSRP